jgi:hypothetical protein
MKPIGIHALLAASCASALLALGCSHNDRQAQTGGPIQAPTPAPDPFMISIPLSRPSGSPAAGAVPVAQASWSEMEGLAYDQRALFVAGLAGLVRRLDSQIGALNARRASMTADTKDWDLSMMGVTAARDYLAGLASEVARASPDTWDQEKDRVGAAWQEAQDACDKVRMSTAS